jgi:hypothetical protein
MTDGRQFSQVVQWPHGYGVFVVAAVVGITVPRPKHELPAFKPSACGTTAEPPPVMLWCFQDQDNTASAVRAGTAAWEQIRYYYCQHSFWAFLPSFIVVIAVVAVFEFLRSSALLTHESCVLVLAGWSAAVGLVLLLLPFGFQSALRGSGFGLGFFVFGELWTRIHQGRHITVVDINNQHLEPPHRCHYSRRLFDPFLAFADWLYIEKI